MATQCVRCAWRGLNGDPLYEHYHDTEWGVPERDPQKLWAKLVLDGFQAGLSWITILRRRDGFYAAFDGFDPDKVARYGEADRARLMADPGIIRSNAKVDAAIGGARLYCEMRDRGEDFADFIWSAVDGRTLQNRWTLDSGVPAQTPEAEKLSKALKAKGFKFVGPVIVYAFMQATGLVNDHLATCFRHQECGAMSG
jgi:DNA-3-methyladenine glycosylase I